jgi:hypothetical protein
MTGPPALLPHHDQVSRGSREKQPRAFGEGGRVRVIGEGGVLLDVCSPDCLGRYLSAPNAEVKRRADGSIRLIRLRSMGDDRGRPGEHHGRSTVTTERVRTESGAPIGSQFNLQHKKTCITWGAPAVEVHLEEPAPRS